LHPNNALLRLHFIVFIWGFTGLLGHLITLQAVPLVWHRILIALSVLFVWIAFRKISLNIPRKDRLLLMLTGTVIAMHWVTFFHAIKISTISVTLACLSTGAFITSLLEPLYLKRPVRLYEVALGALAVVGLVMIFSFETDYWEGMVIALISAFFSANFGLINALWTPKYRPTVITTYEFIGGWLLLGTVVILTGSWEQAWVFGPHDAALLLLLGAACTAYPFIESVSLLRSLSPYTIILTINLEPVYGIILALLFVGGQEQMTPGFYAGAGLILATVAADAWIKRRKKNALPSATNG
jgi:drug/metabolite transporter (DMT)-like permease